jgi:hypothetical protein
MRVILFVLVVLFCSNVNASIDYKKRYEASYSHVKQKSFRAIIRDVIRRKQIKQKPKDKTIPIPLYDSLDWDNLRNLA